MAFATEAVFREDAYRVEDEASVVAVNERGGILLDRTIFYATSGGQPGDTGTLRRADGTEIRIDATITGESKDEIIHLPSAGQSVGPGRHSSASRPPGWCKVRSKPSAGTVSRTPARERCPTPWPRR